MTFEEWPPPDLDETRRAVEEAVATIESEESEILGTKEGYETAARILRADYWGRRAAIRKRLAEVQFLGEDAGWWQTLQEVCGDYFKGLQQGKNVDHWISGQFVVIRSVLGDAPKEPEPGEQFDFWWDQACRAALAALRGRDRQEKMWGYSTLADLYMVALGEGWQIPSTGPVDQQRVIDQQGVIDQLRHMIDEGGGERSCQALWPTFRQFWRWNYWWTTNDRWRDGAQKGYAYLLNAVGIRTQ